MRKLVLIILCAFASFAFSDNNAFLEEKEEVGICDDAGGTAAFRFTVQCPDGFSFVAEGFTCADYVLILAAEYTSICND